MPLNPKASVSHNISEMVHAGHPQNQAIAAALNVARSAKATGGGLYANIHAKQERIAHGSHEHMRRPGAKGAPTAEAFRASERTAKADGGFLPVGHPEREANLNKFNPLQDETGKPKTVYHGTVGNIQEFLNSMTGSSTGAKSAALGHWFTDNPRVAQSYAHYAATYAPVLKLLKSAESAEKKRDWAAHSKYMDQAEELENSFRDPQNERRGQNILPVHLSMKNPHIVDANGGDFNDLEGGLTHHILHAKRNGHDGLIIKNLDDAAGLTNVPATHYMVFHPHQIKSAIGNNGQFDPTNPDITKKVGGYIAKADGGGFSNNQQLGHVPELAPVPKAPTMGNKVVVHEGPIHSPVAGRTDHLPMHVKSGSYVIPADIIGAMGEGNTMAGFKVARRMFSSNPYFQKSMSPYGSSSPIYNSDEKPYGARAAGGGTPGNDDLVPIVAAGGEYVISPQDVTRLGEGDIDNGHKTLDSFVTKYRKKTIKVLQNLPGPKRD